MSNVIEQYKAELERVSRTLAVPLAARVEQLEARISEREKLLAEMRQERGEIVSLLRRVAPDLAPPVQSKGKKAKPKKGAKAGQVSEAKIAEVAEWLQNHRDEINGNGGFTASMLMERYPEEMAVIGVAGTVSKALTILHDRELLQLDRWLKGRARPGKPTGKFFKVLG